MVKRSSFDADPGVVDLVRVTSIDQLKRLGSFREVKQTFQDRLGPGVRVRARSWQGLLEAIRGTVAGCTPRPERHAFFASEAARAIFALLHLHGDPQFDMLDITVRHFGDRRLARRWRDHVARLVHPDRCDHPAAARAMAEVSDIYEAMLEATR